MSTEYIEEIHTCDISGYARGIIQVKVYYNKQDGKVEDWETIGEPDITRNDMEVDTYGIPEYAETFGEK